MSNKIDNEELLSEMFDNIMSPEWDDDICQTGRFSYSSAECVSDILTFAKRHKDLFQEMFREMDNSYLRGLDEAGGKEEILHKVVFENVIIDTILESPSTESIKGFLTMFPSFVVEDVDMDGDIRDVKLGVIRRLMDDIIEMCGPDVWICPQEEKTA